MSLPVTSDAVEVERAASNGSAWRRVLSSPVGLVALIADAVVIFLMALGPWLWGSAAEQSSVTAINLGPSANHLFGTDGLGRDIFYRVLVAARLSVGMSLLATIIGAVLGTALGMSWVLLGRTLGRLVVAVVNIAVAFPSLLLALFFSIIFGVGPGGALLAVAFATVPVFARLAQTLAASVAGLEYVAAARLAGARRGRLLIRHLLPNVAEPLIITATLMAGSSLLTFASLSFLGLGIQPPSFDWGRLLHDGLDGIYTNPLGALAPGLAIVFAGLAFNLTGEVAAAAVGQQLNVSRRRRSVFVRISRARDTAPTSEPTVLAVQDLTVGFHADDHVAYPVRGLTFEVGRAEIVGVVGESGSGKSLTALALADLVRPPGKVDATKLDIAGVDRLAPRRRHRRTTSAESGVSMIFQDPMSTFNPAMKIGAQLTEVMRTRRGASRDDARRQAADSLRAVQIPEPERMLDSYPHEVSGGMRQRAVIAMALLTSPDILIADEPTTALDVVVQAEILQLLAEVRQSTQTAVLLISHDIAVVTSIADRVLVMYAGEIVEELPAHQIEENARHPYTRALLASLPRMTTPRNAPLPTIPGGQPDPAQVPPGCSFAPRCAFATAQCEIEPTLRRTSNHGIAACWHPQKGPIRASATVSTTEPVNDRARRN